MNVHIETITPQRAGELLALNTMNRPSSEMHVSRLAEQMKNGHFVVTGQTIQISSSGKLLDGQHRLMALIEANVSLQFAVATDLPESIFSKLDLGRKRGGSDVLAIAGYANTSMLAALITKLIHYEAGKATKAINRNGGIRPDAILDYAGSHDLDRAVKDGYALSNLGSFLNRSEWAFLSEVLNRIDSDLAPIFLNELASGAGLEKNDVVLFVRNRILRSLTHVSDTLSGAVRMEYAFKAWNRIRDNRRAGMIKILSGELELPR